MVSRHFDDLDAVLEFDALDDFGELISPFNRRHVFAAALLDRTSSDDPNARLGPAAS